MNFEFSQGSDLPCKQRWLSIIMTGLITSACVETGELGEPCNSAGVCLPGLSCEEGICVETMDSTPAERPEADALPPLSPRDRAIAASLDRDLRSPQLSDARALPPSQDADPVCPPDSFLCGGACIPEEAARCIAGCGGECLPPTQDGRTQARCIAGVCVESCSEGTADPNGGLNCTLDCAPEELCNLQDDDCDGQADEGLACVDGDRESCMESGMSGERVCVGCTWSQCRVNQGSRCRPVGEASCEGQLALWTRDLGRGPRAIVDFSCQLFCSAQAESRGLRGAVCCLWEENECQLYANGTVINESLLSLDGDPRTAYFNCE